MLLALDVAFAHCGWVVFDDGKPIACGVIVTEKSSKKTTRVADDNVDRAMLMTKSIKEVIEQFGVRGIIGELPHGGALSARAIKDMALAVGVIAATAALFDLPCEWCSPSDNKLAMTGIRTASKRDMIEAAISYFGGDIQKKGNARMCRLAKLQAMAEGTFEHVADAASTYKALERGNLVKLFG